MQNYVVLRKIGGFYSSFDEGGMIISYLCNYNFKNGKCGFPLNTLDKVINILENNKINYIIKDGIDDKVKKDFKKQNKFDITYNKAKKKNNIDIRINDIINRINKLELNNIINILDIIEDYLDEQGV